LSTSLAWNTPTFRHPREDGDPEGLEVQRASWIPASAGMTTGASFIFIKSVGVLDLLADFFG